MSRILPIPIITPTGESAVGKQRDHKVIADLPLVIAATFLVAVAPLLLVFSLRGSGVVTSAWVGTAIGVAVSLLASSAGATYWKTRIESRDVVFSELMLWGWVQRWRSERRLTAAADLLGLTAGRPRAISGGRLTNEQKASLLTQLTSGLEARDPYTHGHSRRVARLAASIAKQMGLSRAEVAKIRAAGAMHDVGKAETPIAVLRKEGKLTSEEYAIIKRHPVDGAEMVSTLHDAELTAMVRHHHERLDGAGYPDGLAGEAIPIGARVLAVADTFDAITSTRPYRRAHAHKEALDILVSGAGTQLDPDAVRAFCSYYSGRRPLAWWMLLAYGRPRLASLAGGGLGPINAGATQNIMATVATTAALGGVALGSFANAPIDSSRSGADAQTATASSTATARSRVAAPPTSALAASTPALAAAARDQTGASNGRAPIGAQQAREAESGQDDANAAGRGRRPGQSRRPDKISDQSAGAGQEGAGIDENARDAKGRSRAKDKGRRTGRGQTSRPSKGSAAAPASGGAADRGDAQSSAVDPPPKGSPDRGSGLVPARLLEP